MWGRYFVNGCTFFSPFEVLEIFWNQDSVVDIVTRLEPERRRIGPRLLTWTRNFLLCVQTGSAVTQPPVLWVPEASLLVKWLGHEGDHSPACNAEVKNARSIPLYSLEFLLVVVCYNARVEFYLSIWEY